jgi:hypothetical protein
VGGILFGSAMADGRTEAAGPVIDERFEEGGEFFEAAGFGEVGVHAAAISFLDVFFEARATEHHAGEAVAMGVAAQPFEDIQAGHFGHFKVHQEEVGEGVSLPVVKSVSMAQIINDLFPVMHHVNLGRDVMPLKGEAHELTVARVVLGDQND